MISEVVHHIQILQNTHKTDLSASVRLAAVVVLHRRLLTAVAHRLIVKLDPLTLAFASAFELLSKAFSPKSFANARRCSNGRY